MADCRIRNSYNLLYVKTNRRRGGVVDNIFVEDIDTDSVKNSVFGIETDVLYQWAKFPDYELKYTKILNVNVRNVHAKCANWAVNVQGDAHEPVRGIRLENVSLDAARKGFSNIVNAKDVVMKDVALGDAEPTKWQQPIDEVWHRK